MKYIKYLLIIVLFIPFIVLAEDCDISKITITSIEQTAIEGNTEVIDEPSYQGRNINLNLKMYEVGDSITYDLVVNNASNEDYMIDENTFKSDSDYIEYVLSINDNSNVVKANSSKNMTLTVSYKNEIDNSLLTNNKYNASNKLYLSMNTAAQPKEIKEISTDPEASIIEKPIVKEVKNPITSSIGFKLLIVILLTTIVIILLTVINKKQYNKYFILLSIIYLIPTIYAVCTCNIEVESTIEIEKIPRLFDTVVGLSNETNACVEKYNGEVTDQVGETVTASNVYFNKCVDKRNIIFNNMCWQMIRTTETGGTKMIYNGEPVDGKCESSRGDHKGIVGATGSTTLNAECLYGDSFTYDTTNNTFTLTDTTTAIWSDSTYENLIGKFTCENTEGTCTTLYNVNGYESNTTAYTSSYTIGDTNYASIGTSAFNANYRSPAMVGYMFNKVYNYKYGAPTSGSLMGNDVFYSNGTYTLLPASGESELGTTKDATHHYTCNTTSSTCTKVRYYYYNSGSRYYYIELDGEANIEEAINNMLYNNNVNRYNSSIKGIIDAWYKQNLLSKTNMLEDTVYCNARNMTNQSTNGWNKDGSLTTYMNFKNYTLNNDLSCTNVTDQFAVSNNKAKLTYPVSLATHEELYTLTNNNDATYYDVLTNTGDYWWGISPNSFYNDHADVRYVSFDGIVHSIHNRVEVAYGVRLVVSLKNSVKITSGDGSEESPWIIER